MYYPGKLIDGVVALPEIGTVTVRDLLDSPPGIGSGYMGA